MIKKLTAVIFVAAMLATVILGAASCDTAQLTNMLGQTEDNEITALTITTSPADSQSGHVTDSEQIKALLADFVSLDYDKLSPNNTVKKLFASEQVMYYRMELTFADESKTQLVVLQDGSVWVNCNYECYFCTSAGAVDADKYYSKLQIGSWQSMLNRALGESLVAQELVVTGSPLSSYIGRYSDTDKIKQFLQPLQKVVFSRDDSATLSAEMNQYGITCSLSDGTSSTIQIISDGSVVVLYRGYGFVAPAASVDWNYYCNLQRLI